MAKRSSVTTLPSEVKEWLDRALAENGFANYQLLSDELKSRGFEISKSAVHRYGQQFEERLSALKLASEQARAVVAASPDDENSMNEALMRLVQEKMFSVIMDLEVDPAKLNIASLAKSIAELGRASVSQKKWMAEARDLARKEASEALDQAAEDVAAEAEREQLSPVQILERVKAIYRGEA